MVRGAVPDLGGPVVRAEGEGVGREPARVERLEALGDPAVQNDATGRQQVGVGDFPDPVVRELEALA